MFDRPLNPALARRLEEFGILERLPATLGTPSTLAPTLVLVSDPVEDVEGVLEQLAGGGPQGAHPWSVAYLARKGKLQPGTVTRRECCTREAEKMHHNLPHLKMPHEFTCPTCRAVYRLEMRVLNAAG